MSVFACGQTGLVRNIKVCLESTHHSSPGHYRISAFPSGNRKFAEFICLCCTRFTRYNSSAKAPEIVEHAYYSTHERMAWPVPPARTSIFFRTISSRSALRPRRGNLDIHYLYVIDSRSSRPASRHAQLICVTLTFNPLCNSPY